MGELYVLMDQHICKKRNNTIKYLVCLKQFSASQQEEIVKNLNANFSSLVIQKYPYLKKKFFLINSKPYLEQYWCHMEKKFIVILYNLDVENHIKKIVEKEQVDENKTSYRINLFRGSELVKYNKNNHCLIKYNRNNHKCEIFDQCGNEIKKEEISLSLEDLIIGDKFGVDIESFGDFTRNEIRNFITNFYGLNRWDTI